MGRWNLGGVPDDSYYGTAQATWKILLAYTLWILFVVFAFG